MSCNCNYSHCDECNPCSQLSNPCYDNVGCLNPTTWACLTNPGIYQTLGITDNMSGLEVLAAIKSTIDNLVVGIPPSGNDKFVKITSGDTTAQYLDDKLAVVYPLQSTILSPGQSEKIRLSLAFAGLISSDNDNAVEIGTDGKLRVLPTVQDPDISVVGGSGVTVAGQGSSSDPFVVSINPSISVKRNCFDGVWKNITLTSPGNANVVYVGGTPQYRIRFDGSIEFKGSLTYTVSFGAYTTTNRKYTVPLGSVLTSCLTAGEQNGLEDIKSITYIDQSGVGDQITQMYGYIVRKNSQNYILEFQSAYILPTVKTIVVNLQGMVVHPNI